MSTDVQNFIGELDAGVFEQKVARALSDVALGVVTNGKAGSVTLKFDMKQIADSGQVTIAQKLSQVIPTTHGKLSEENTTPSTMYVGRNGALTLYPENQVDMFNPANKKQEA